MASKPRPSLLDLFDPLLAKAVNIPIPESPPTTPQRSVENKENLYPNELSMSVFFNRISRTMATSSPTMKPASISSFQLVELEDADAGSPHARAPLIELCLNDFSIPSNLQSDSGSSYQKDRSFNHTRLSATIPLPPSPLCETQLHASYPTISVDDSYDLEGSPKETTKDTVDPFISENIQPCRQHSQPSPSKALLPPNSNKIFGHRDSRRRSSIDIPTTLTSLSSNSFCMADASFDLVNGEISFLSKGSEDNDEDNNLLIDSLEFQTPRANSSPKNLTTEENVPDLLKTTNSLSVNTITCAQPSITQNFAQAVHDQQPTVPTLSNSFRRTICDEDPPMQPLSTATTVNMGTQDTPPSARVVSSVPAPVKRLKVFTSKDHRVANPSTKRGVVGVAATSSGTSLVTSRKTHEQSTTGAPVGGSYNSSIPRGGAGRRTVVGGTVVHNGKPAVSDRAAVATNMKITKRTAARSIETSASQGGETVEQTSRMGAIPRLPGPAGARIGTIASQRLSKLPGSIHVGRNISTRSATLRPTLAREVDRGMEH